MENVMKLILFLTRRYLDEDSARMWFYDWRCSLSIVLYRFWRELLRCVCVVSQGETEVTDIEVICSLRNAESKTPGLIIFFLASCQSSKQPELRCLCPIKWKCPPPPFPPPPPPPPRPLLHLRHMVYDLSLVNLTIDEPFIKLQRQFFSLDIILASFLQTSQVANLQARKSTVFRDILLVWLRM